MRLATTARTAWTTNQCDVRVAGHRTGTHGCYGFAGGPRGKDNWRTSDVEQVWLLPSHRRNGNNSRHGFKAQPAARKVAGAFAEEKDSAPMKRKPGTASTRAGKASALKQVKSR